MSVTKWVKQTFPDADISNYLVEARYFKTTNEIDVFQWAQFNTCIHRLFAIEAPDNVDQLIDDDELLTYAKANIPSHITSSIPSLTLLVGTLGRSRPPETSLPTPSPVI